MKNKIGQELSEKRIPWGLHHSDPFWDTIGRDQNEDENNINMDDGKFTNGGIIVPLLFVLFAGLVAGVIYITSNIK